MSRHTYQIDLPGQHAECEANYARIRRLLGWLGDVDEAVVGLPEDVEIRLQIAECGPYTTTLQLRVGSGFGRSWLPVPALTVRVYHDARMAEVVACNGQQRPQGRYQYPNRRMFQPDEKAQWNRFLGEWLSYCLRFGYALAGPKLRSCEL